jgi:hypothetical protein
MADKAARDARLESLRTAIEQYAEKQRGHLENEVEFAKRILKGRPGSEGLNNESVTAASDLVVDELDEFLSG